MFGEHTGAGVLMTEIAPGTCVTCNPDFHVFDQGAFWIVQPMTEAGDECAAEHLDPEEQTLFGNGVVVEPRCMPAIPEGLADAGLLVASPSSS